MADYFINIDMDQNTANGLLADGYFLYAFKAVQTSNKGGLPLVWFQTQSFATTTGLSWQVAYAAYTGLKTEIKSGATIKASNSYDIDLGNTLSVNTSIGTGDVTVGGQAGAVKIVNSSGTGMICGLSQQVEGKANPLCAIRLTGNGTDIIAPLEKVFLMFATEQINTGTALIKSYGQGVFVDMTGADANTRSLKYDIDKGWDWDGKPWAKKEPADTDLLPLLFV